METLILAASLWFSTFQAMNGTVDENAKLPLPWGGGSYTTQADCVKGAAARVEDFTKHNPLPGTKWASKCAKKVWKARTFQELDTIHNEHAHPNHKAMEGM